MKILTVFQRVIFSSKSLFLISSIFLLSCVGTIEDTEKQESVSAAISPGSLSFPGILSATAISHNKVEITFPPAGGSSGDVTYLIKYDGLDDPITAIEKSLFRDYTGVYKYTVTSLTPFTTYSFNVTAVDDDTGAEGNNSNVIKATTFLQPTAEFNGIGMVSNLQGLAGLNSLKVEWVKAPKFVDFGNPDPRDVAQYQVIVLDAEFNPGSLNDSTIPNNKRREILLESSQREAIVGGLQPGREYHVQVRAINHGYVDNISSDSSYKYEQNTKYLSKSTLTPGLNDIDFDEDSFFMEVINGEAGLSSLNANWIAAEGAFNHYRIYYVESTNNDGVNYAFDLYSNFYAASTHPGGTACTTGLLESTPFKAACACTNHDTNSDASDDLFCEQVDFTLETKLVANLKPYTEYNIMMLICADINCKNYTRSVMLSNVETRPKITNFEFQALMRAASSVSRLDELYIDLKELPDFSTGVLNGFFINVRDEDGNEIILGDPNNPINEQESENLPPIRMLDYNPKEDTTITLTGYDLTESPKYTITLTPYQYDGADAILSDNLKKVYTEVQFTPKPPGEYNTNTFEGAVSCADPNNNGTYRLEWSAPPLDSGVFSHYQIYIENKGVVTTDLSITGAAITYPALPLIDLNTTSHTIEGLSNTDNYVATVRTYYYYNSAPLLNPEDDSEIILCD